MEEYKVIRNEPKEEVSTKLITYYDVIRYIHINRIKRRIWNARNKRRINARR